MEEKDLSILKRLEERRVKYDARFLSSAREDKLKGVIETTDGTKLLVTDKQVVICEDYTDSESTDAQFSVGLKITCRKVEGAILHGVPEQYGNYVYLPHDAKLTDVIAAIEQMASAFNKFELIEDK